MRLLPLIFAGALLASCAHKPVVELDRRVVCVESEDEGYYCYDVRYVSCHCSDSSCMCNPGYSFDLETCKCVPDPDGQNDNGFWDDYQKGLEGFYAN
jgi:hypothetical protein